MTAGGSRNRAGARPDPTSARSAARSLTFRQLPAVGHDGKAPAFPLPKIPRFSEHFEDGKKIREGDEGGTEAFRERELDLWTECWTYPQADAWATEPHRWQVIAEYCRLKTVVESEPDASAALMAQIHRYRDQIGLTPAGLKENGWEIGVTREVDSIEPAPSASTSGRKSARERGLKLVQDGVA